MTADRFCVNCGSPLQDGVCTNCAAHAAAAAAAPPPPVQPPPGQTWSAQPSYAQPSFAPSTAFINPAQPGARYLGQWNWGAFFLTPFWLMNHGRVGLGIVALVLSLIPGLNVGALIIGIWGGIKGNELAVTGRRFFDDAQFVAVQNAWRNWGFAIFALMVVLTIVGGILKLLAVVITQTMSS